MVGMRKLLLLLGASICYNVVVNAQNVVRIDLTQNPNKPSQSVHIMLAPDVATCNYGFFCKQELKGDKILPMPVRFRMGSMQQTDWLEQKPNTIAPAR